MLNADQENALNGIMRFIETPVETFADCTTLIFGSAGSGKSFLTRYIADELRKKRKKEADYRSSRDYSIAGVAPTHKARKVLDRFLNSQKGNSPFANVSNPIASIKTMTVASLLNKMREHHYIGVDHYASTGSKINLYDIFIVDEASMINDEDVKSMINYTFTYKKKMIFVGDKYQIPNPTQAFICRDGHAYKGDSIIFNIGGYE